MKPDSSISNIHDDVVNEGLTPEEIEIARGLEDPVLWAETHLRNPDDPSEFVQLRWYQKIMIRWQPHKYWDNSQKKFVWKKRKKLYRCGRRVGKSVCVLMEALWLAYTNSHYRVIVLTPYEQQLRRAWTVLKRLMGDQVTASRIVEKPFIIEFSNGSTITGYIGGVKKDRSSTVRGEGADAICVMEMDHGIDHILSAVMVPILTGKASCRWIGDSTPSGARGLFYQWCTKPESRGGAKDFHYASNVSPEWNDDAEQEARSSCQSDAEYQHEYMAEWGELTQGVFKTPDVDDTLVKNTYRSYKKDPFKLSCVYCMGVDWNQAYGVKIYIVEYDPNTHRYRTVLKREVPNDEYTQTNAVTEIIELNKKWPLTWIYVDKGYGTTQVELLHKYGKAHPESKLHKTVKAIDFKSNVVLKDPRNGQKIKKPLKPFCVAAAARVVENGQIDIPEEEDDKFGLVGQMRGYRQRTTPSGTIVFEAQNRDDLLIAWILALLAFNVEMGEFTKYENARIFKHIKDPMGVESKFKKRTVGLDSTFRKRYGAGRSGVKSRKPWRPIVPGSKVRQEPKKNAPIGSTQRTPWPTRRPLRNGPRRSNF